MSYCPDCFIELCIDKANVAIEKIFNLNNETIYIKKKGEMKNGKNIQSNKTSI
jgi:hypothetical protein